MLLLSENLSASLPSGPVFPQAYPEIEPDVLSNSDHFTFTRLPDIEYAGGIEIAPNNFVHAIRKLPVRFTPQKSSS